LNPEVISLDLGSVLFGAGNGKSRQRRGNARRPSVIVRISSGDYCLPLAVDDDLDTDGYRGILSSRAFADELTWTL
jgi:hypothetical protein